MSKYIAGIKLFFGFAIILSIVSPSISRASSPILGEDGQNYVLVRKIFTGVNYGCYRLSEESLIAIKETLSTPVNELSLATLERNKTIDAIIEVGRATSGPWKKKNVGADVKELTDEIIKALNTFKTVTLIYHELKMPLDKVGAISNLLGLTMPQSEFIEAKDISALTGLKGLKILGLNAFPVNVCVAGSGEEYNDLEADFIKPTFKYFIGANLVTLKEANPRLLVTSNDY